MEQSRSWKFYSSRGTITPWSKAVVGTLQEAFTFQRRFVPWRSSSVQFTDESEWFVAVLNDPGAVGCYGDAARLPSFTEIFEEVRRLVYDNLQSYTF